MAYCRASIDVELPIDELFAYLLDFTNAARWDPGVTRARRVSRGPIATGTIFELRVRMLGREVPMRYTLVQADPPSRIVFEGGTDWLRSVDILTLEKARRGSRLHYEAQLMLPGLLYLADLPLHLAFQRVGRRAIAGLERALAEHAGEA